MYNMKFVTLTIFKHTVQWHCAAVPTIRLQNIHLPKQKLCPHET